MTKQELIKQLENLADDTVIYLYNEEYGEAGPVTGLETREENAFANGKMMYCQVTIIQ